MRGDDSDRNDSDHEPCSTGGGPVTAPQRPPPPSQIFTKKSQPELSPLRLALSSKSPPLSSSTPILTASLNRPPVIVTSCIDLSKRTQSVTSNKITSSMTQQLLQQHQQHQHQQQQQQHKNDNRTLTPEIYANLLMQLRRASDNDANPAFKLTAAARKERLKLQPCFQCPVCKKRFQRHIAMNAHFQNEHIGQTSNDADKKVCRLCSHVAADIVAVRQHLVKHHNIDLENPAASLVEPEPTPTSSTTTTFNGDLIISRRSSPVTITDSSVDLITSSVSPDRTSPVLGPVKIELIEDHIDEQEQAKDLSIRGQQQQRHRRTSPEIIHIGRKRAASPSPVKVVKKSPKLSQSTQNNNSSKNNNNNEVSEIDSNWQCQHCNITFPNQTLYFLHRGFHSDSNPWRCNGCGVKCSDMFDFNTHLVSDPHR